MTKKIVFIVVLIIALLMLGSCDWNAPLRENMYEYYFDDSVYVRLEGTLIDMEWNQHAEMFSVMIEIVTENHGFDYDLNTGYSTFSLLNADESLSTLAVGDLLEIISAPMAFYNGHYPPIIGLQRGDEVLLGFQEGKSSYLQWIETTFD